MKKEKSQEVEFIEEDKELFSEEDKEKMNKRLKALGYLD